MTETVQIAWTKEINYARHRRHEIVPLNNGK